MSHESDTTLHPPARPLLIILSGLSGAGKDVVLTGLRESSHPLDFIVTVTTRTKRPAETDGVHYRFVSKDSFQQLIGSNELLEWANVYGNLYGVPKEPVRQALEKQRDVIIKVDVQGAATIKEILPQAVFIFLAPTSIEELGRRLKNRCTESPADLELRLRTAGEEIEKLPLFDYLVFNREGEIGRAVADIEAIITAEKCRVKSRKLVL